MVSIFSRLIPVVLIVLVSAPESSWARKFNFNSEYFASYFRGTGGSSNVADGAFGSSSGTATNYTDEVAYNFSGEVGFLISPAEKVAVRLGVEILQAKPLNDIKGKDTAGNELLTLTSTVFVFSPIVTAEMAFVSEATSRAFVYAGAGMANVTMENQYTFTTTGQSTLGAPANYSEKAEQNLIYWHLGVGYEVLFVDNVTASFDLGYRHLPIKKLKYKSDLSDMVDDMGSATKDDEVTNQDGGNRSVDMSGPYVGVAFKFYIELL